MLKVLNRYLIQDGELGSAYEAGNNDAFLIPYQSFTLRVVASDGMGWEHVSVSLRLWCTNPPAGLDTRRTARHGLDMSNSNRQR